MTIARGSAITAATDSTGSSIASLSTSAYSQSAGECLIVIVRWEGSTTQPTGVTDTAGNTFTPRSAGTFTTDGMTVRIYDCLDTAANASNVITVTWPSAVAQFVALVPSRYTKTGTVTFNAEPTPATGTSNSPATGSFSAGDFAVGAVANFSGLTASSSNAGWTTQFNTSIGCMTQDRVDSPGGTYAAGATLSGSADWAIVAASYTESVGAPSFTTQPTSQVQKVNTQATFTVAVSFPGTGPSYQWKIDTGTGYVNVGTNSATYTTDSLQLWDAANVKCTATDSTGSTDSNVVSLTVYDRGPDTYTPKRRRKATTAFNTSVSSWWR